MIGRIARAIASCAMAALLHAGALAHDAGIANGVFRSRDGGATWLQVNTESFAPGALALAVHPGDPHHLLLATDSGLLRSRNGGRDWQPDAQNVLPGATFAVVFDANGRDALASGADGLYRFDGERWRATRTPAGAAPARVLVSGGVTGRVYLAGWSGLHRSDDGGRSWTRIGQPMGDAPITALAVSPQRPDELHALAGGRVWHSVDGARRWRVDDGAPAPAQALATDAAMPARLWLVSGGRAHKQDDRAARWQAVGTPLPDAQAIVRGIDVERDAMLVSTDRGVFRSTDAGASWSVLSAELPNHSETTLLMRDPHATGTLYAGFSRLSAEQLKGATPPADAPLARSDVALLVGAYAGFALLLLVAGVCVRRATRRRAVDLRAEST